MKEFSPLNLLQNPNKFQEIDSKIASKKLEDDVTIIEIDRIANLEHL